MHNERQQSGNTNPFISIVTATFNAAELLEDTITSLRAQGFSDFEWIVVDGGSTDGTIELIQKNSDLIGYWCSESDRGMYDAMAKGFEQSKGEIVCWLNAGDIFLQGALGIVADTFKSRKDVNWITGMQLTHLPGGKVVGCFLPVKFSSNLIRCGAYGKTLPYIQQESTFFRRNLLSYVDFEKFREYKLAGDLYFWNCLSRKTELTVIYAGLGSFCIHEGQLSQEIEAYWHEAESFLEPFSISKWMKSIIQRPLQYLPGSLKKKVAGPHFLMWKKGKGWH